MKTYQKLAKALQWLESIDRSGASIDHKWHDKAEADMDAVMETAPSGSGFDSGTELDEIMSNQHKLVFPVDFHHMNDGGYYSGWTHHKVIVTPTFLGFDLKITGRDKNDIKDYIGETFQTWLDS